MSPPAFSAEAMDVDASWEAGVLSEGSRGVELDGGSGRNAARTTVTSCPFAASISSSTSAGALRIGDHRRPPDIRDSPIKSAT
jgi:hypothetical protein